MELIDHWQRFFRQLEGTRLAAWRAPLQTLTADQLHPSTNGDLPRWIAALGQLPPLPSTEVKLTQGTISVGPPLAASDAAALAAVLDCLHPWRKGPFSIHGVEIDTEWRSDWKWARLEPALPTLDGWLVLDLGCGNGYYAYRTLGAGARLVLGVDPTLRFVMQFLAVNQYIGTDQVAVLPLADHQLPATLSGFDLVFSMGVLYHQRDPAAHLQRARRLLRPSGMLILETLILDQTASAVLIPQGRYAKMRNVHAIPTLDHLTRWVQAAGFHAVETININHTTTAEQRATPWMRFQSLADFLDPSDPSCTIEGYPAPCRALLRAIAS